jgi:hypothetical protein
LREVFDAMTGKVSTIMRVSTVSGNGRLNGTKMSAVELEKSSVTSSQGKTVTAQKVDGAVEFYFEGMKAANMNDFTISKSNVIALPTERLSKTSGAGGEACRILFKSN